VYSQSGLWIVLLERRREAREKVWLVAFAGSDDRDMGNLRNRFLQDICATWWVSIISKSRLGCQPGVGRWSSRVNLQLKIADAADYEDKHKPAQAEQRDRLGVHEGGAGIIACTSVAASRVLCGLPVGVYVWLC
jgi:hypothetical protein